MSQQVGTPPWKLIYRFVDWKRGQPIKWKCTFEGGLGEHSLLTVEVPEAVWRAFDGIDLVGNTNLMPGDSISGEVGFTDR